MSELVYEAATILVPFIAAGGGAVAGGAAQEAGGDLNRVARSLIEKLGNRIRGNDWQAVVAALRKGLADKVIEIEELRTLILLHKAARRAPAKIGQIRSKYPNIDPPTVGISIA